jgi:hypothetical protein
LRPQRTLTLAEEEEKDDVEEKKEEKIFTSTPIEDDCLDAWLH